MHYEKHYKGLEPIAKHNQAIKDIKAYLGVNKFNQLTKIMREDFKEPPTIEYFTNIVSLAGIHGYPVKAWYNYAWGL